MIPTSVFTCRHKKASSVGNLSELNSGSPYIYVKNKISGKKEPKFHVNFIEILENVFRHNATKYMSIEQERFLAKFFAQANKVTNETGSYDEHLDDTFKAFDQFLGNYVGENNGQYAR